MKVLVVGSGGREHALAWKISQSPLLTKLYAAPGNAGIAQVAECVDLSVDDYDGILAFVKKEAIDLTVVGPEAPLVGGLVDKLEAEGFKVFGPNQAAARLEASKAFSKDKMLEFNIPTAQYEVFKHINEAKHYAVEAELPLVIKADGLAAGKGVKICQSSQEAVQALTEMMEENVFGDAGTKVVIEQCLEGEELSVLALTDGKKIIPLASSQDHKRAYDHDQGPNTGGMGAYSPCPQISKETFDDIVELTVRPMIEGLAKEGITYRGVLYAGIMMTADGPKVLEYNCRFGDPEAQVVLPRLKSDLLSVMAEIANGEIQEENLEWHDKACLGVVLASGGYPGSYKKGRSISGTDALAGDENSIVFHAGTKTEDNVLLNAGGRVLVVSGLGETLKDARDKAYEGIEKIQLQDSFYRKDIGAKALKAGVPS